MSDALTISSAPGVELEAELAVAAEPRVGVVLCHPHPQYGGTMRSIVIGALFDALPAIGASTLRFNFRGVERSTGTYDNGRGEADDARAALQALRGAVEPGTPIVLAGWSFGGDVALSVLDGTVAAWVAIAPPLRFADAASVGADPRPKLLLLGEHDEVRPPDDVVQLESAWTDAEVHVIPGASHFFIGRTDQVVALTVAFLDRLTA
jgi:alpha/beta superfamily hydrolase